MAAPSTERSGPLPQQLSLPFLRPAGLVPPAAVPVPPAVVWTGLTPQLRARVCQAVLLAVQEVVHDADDR